MIQSSPVGHHVSLDFVAGVFQDLKKLARRFGIAAENKLGDQILLSAGYAAHEERYQDDKFMHQTLPAS